ncbi:MAG: ribonuclease R family protein, partial [Terriglobales bacterium]
PAPAVAPGARRPDPRPAPPADREFSGVLSLHRDGFGFVTPDPTLPPAGDIFIPPRATAGAMHGDRVRVAMAPPAHDGRTSGRVVAIERRAQQTLVGTFHCTPSGNYVAPIDDRLRYRILIPPGAEQPGLAATPPDNAGGPDRVLDPAVHRTSAAAGAQALDGQVVEIELTRFPTETSAGRGRVLEILGRRDDFGVDVEIIIRKHHLPHRFPPAVLAEAAAIPAPLPAAEVARRRDFRHLPIVTIDGESARDFDDAVHVAPLPEGGFELQVHIADVDHYVPPGSALDEEARLRGTSVYFPDRAVPMLPQELSTGLCSLRPHEDRLVVSCLMRISPRGEVVGHELALGVIRSAARMTYTEVNAVIEGDAAARARHAPLVEGFEHMAALQAVLYAERQRRGAIDFDLPEPEIAFDEFGLMRSIVKSERNIAHRLIEEFMLAAAGAVARHLRDAGQAAVYRIHEQPELKKVAEFEDIAAGFGYSLGVGPLPIQTIRFRARPGAGRAPRPVETPQEGKFRISPRHYQQLAARVAGKPEERMLSYLMLRSLKQARYSAKNVGHFALATDCYTHFTSPIRRYPDLVVHRIVKALLAGEQAASGARGQAALGPALPNALRSDSGLEPIARHASEAERRAADAERELMAWKKVRYMEQRLGEVFPALILRVTRDGLQVELGDLFIEGWVPADALRGDDYRFRSTTMEWVGERRRRRLRLGMRVEVQAERIDPVRQEVLFGILE